MQGMERNKIDSSMPPTNTLQEAWGIDRTPSGMKCERDSRRRLEGKGGMLQRRVSCGEMGALVSGGREGLKADKHTTVVE